MQVSQTLNEGLKRQFQVLVSVADLSKRFDSELESIRGKVNLNGFRPGKVPTGHIKRLYGKSVMGEVVQAVVAEAQKKIVDEQDVRLAGEPKLTFSEDQAVFEKVYALEADLDFSIEVEILPNIEIADHSGISVVRETAEASEADVEEAITRMADSNRTYAPRAEKEKAKDGDKLTIDFVGTLEGVAFEGGTGGDVALVLGSNQFIPGFEAQLVGAKLGDEKTVKVTFPADYGAAHLAGKEAEFAVTVKGVEAPVASEVNDELAQKFGLADVAALREAVKGSLEDEIKEVSRQKVKRQLLDALDALYTFELPANMLEDEFQSVWRQVQADSAKAGQPIEDNEINKAEYKGIAARRVRLGLVLAEIGQKAEIKVEDAEVTQALVLRARQFPGQEKQVFDYYRKNPQALAEIRAPLFEEKVVDHIIAGVKVEEKAVSRAALLDEGDEAGESEQPKKAPAKKKAKVAAEAEAEPAAEAADAEQPKKATKKAPAKKKADDAE